MGKAQHNRVKVQLREGDGWEGEKIIEKEYVWRERRKNKFTLKKKNTCNIDYMYNPYNINYICNYVIKDIFKLVIQRFFISKIWKIWIKLDVIININK